MVKSYDRVDVLAALEGVDHARLDESLEVFGDVVVARLEPSPGVRPDPWCFDGDDAKRIGVRREQQPEPECGRRDGG